MCYSHSTTAVVSAQQVTKLIAGEEQKMSKQIKLWLMAIALTALLASDSLVFAAARPRRTPRSYQRGVAAAAPSQPGINAARPNTQGTRRYSFTPGGSTYSTRGYSYSPSGTLGTNRNYRPGPGYSPRHGINSADFKIKGL